MNNDVRKALKLIGMIFSMLFLYAKVLYIINTSIPVVGALLEKFFNKILGIDEIIYDDIDLF